MTSSNVPSTILTVAVPTYNRATQALERASQLRAIVQQSALNALFVDDGSTDGTFDALHRACEDLPQISVRRNDTNRGLAPAMIRCIEESTSEWVMLTADDDLLIADGVRRMAQDLTTVDADFVSPQRLRSDGSHYRGRVVPGQIAAHEAWKSADHAPGIAFRRSAVQEILPRLERMLTDRSDAALVYPQVVLAVELVARSRGVWLPYPVVKSGAELRSGIRDSRGRTYTDRSARLAQSLAFQQVYLEMLRQAGTTAAYRRRSREMLAANELRIFARLGDIARETNSAYPGIPRGLLRLGLGLRGALLRLLQQLDAELRHALARRHAAPPILRH